MFEDDDDDVKVVVNRMPDWDFECPFFTSDTEVCLLAPHYDNECLLAKKKTCNRLMSIDK